jgi:hypothetical protein
MSRWWEALRNFVFFAWIAFAILQGMPRSMAEESSRIDSALQILWRVPTGHALLTKAMKTWKLSSPAELNQVVRPGTASRTDAVLTRHYNPATGEEVREREVLIYVRLEQSLDNIILDIAHEMVHATSRPDWDPYDPELTSARYIKNSIEGQGGEVEAVTQECRVASELGSRFGVATHRCRNYVVGSSTGRGKNQIDVHQITADFYKVGQWGPELAKALGSQIKLFPDLSTEPPRLFSSTGNAPYPEALLKEFEALTQIACENSKRRADSLRVHSIAAAREPAEGQDATFLFLERRCQ